MPPVTLFRYISLRSLIAFGAIYGVLAGLVFLADLIENMRFAGKVENGNFGFALQLTALRTLGLTQALTPFVFLFGSTLDTCIQHAENKQETTGVESAR